MRNLYKVESAKVMKVVAENPTTKTLYFKLKNQSKFEFLPGQFMQIGLAGFGECPISISSNPKDAGKYFSLTIRGVGELTNKLISLKQGEEVLVRGPFGNGFPEITKNLVLIGGGCGFIPLISVWEENRKRKDIKIQIFASCRSRETVVFQSEFNGMKEGADFNFIMDEDVWPGHSSKKGIITDLLKEKNILSDAVVLICGPQVMYGPVIKELLKKKVLAENIYLSLEKRMHCGLGVCQHCAIGTKYICKDGPVFSYNYLMTVPGYLS